MPTSHLLKSECHLRISTSKLVHAELLELGGGRRGGGGGGGPSQSKNGGLPAAF